MNPPLPVLALPVEVTPEQVPALDSQVAQVLGGTGLHLLVDLREVVFLSSGGLGFLVKLSKRLHDRGGAIALARPGPRSRGSCARWASNASFPPSPISTPRRPTSSGPSR